MIAQRAERVLREIKERRVTVKAALALPISRNARDTELLCLEVAFEGLVRQLEYGRQFGHTYAVTAAENQLATLCDRWDSV